MRLRLLLACMAVLLALAIAPLHAADLDEVEKDIKRVMRDPNSNTRDKVNAIRALTEFSSGGDCEDACDILFDILEQDDGRTLQKLQAQQDELKEKVRRIYEQVKNAGNRITTDQQEELAKLEAEIDVLEDQMLGLEKVKEAAIYVLASYESADGREMIIEGIEDSDWRIAVGAIKAAMLQGWDGAYDAVAEHYPADGRPAKDVPLRIAAVQYFGHAAKKKGVDNVIAALADEADVVRLQAILATRKVREPECIPALINRLGVLDDDGEWEKVESGRLRWEVVRALRDLTGAEVNYGDDPQGWKMWWNANGSGFRCPPPSDVSPMADEGDEEGEGSTVNFFGVPIETLRPVFVIDRSSSMLWAVDPNVARQQGAGYQQGQPIPPVPAGHMSKWEMVQNELFDTITKLKELADQREETAYFGLVYYGTDVVTYAQGQMIEASDSSLKRLERFLTSEIEAEGLTNIYDAMKEAFKIAQGGQGNPGSVFTGGEEMEEIKADTIIFLTDGSPTTGPSINGIEATNPPNQPYIQALFNQIILWNQSLQLRIDCVSIGGPSPLLEGLAKHTGGAYREVTEEPDDDD